MTKFAEELRGLRFGLESRLSDEDFVARVMTACDAVPQPIRRRTSARSALWGYGVALATAAAACVAVGVSGWQVHVTAPESVRGTTTPRGNHQAGLGVSVQAFVARAAPGGAPPLLEGAQLHPGDGILVRYSNPGNRPVFLMVFALDEQRTVHWIHPAYLNESSNPTSLRLAQRVTDRVLDEVAEPENPAPGSLRVYALLSAAPLDVKRVESTLAGSTAATTELFPQTEIEEWRCTWHAR